MTEAPRFTTRRLYAAFAASSLLLAGCGEFGALALASDDRGVVFRTSDTRYTLAIEEGIAKLEIPFTYENHTGRTLHVVNCNGMAPPVLEKREGERWVLAYAPAVPACLSAAILIRDGDTYSGTLYVDAAVPASRDRQSFEVEEVEGTYRLVWPGVLYEFDATGYPFGEEVELELRTGEEFFIDDPRSDYRGARQRGRPPGSCGGCRRSARRRIVRARDRLAAPFHADAPGCHRSGLRHP